MNKYDSQDPGWLYPVRDANSIYEYLRERAANLPWTFTRPAISHAALIFEESTFSSWFPISCKIPTISQVQVLRARKKLRNSRSRLPVFPYPIRRGHKSASFSRHVSGRMCSCEKLEQPTFPRPTDNLISFKNSIRCKICLNLVFLKSKRNDIFRRKTLSISIRINITRNNKYDPKNTMEATMRHPSPRPLSNHH